MNNLPNAVLSIYIPNQGYVAQGKICLIGDKWNFVANMTENKLFRNYNGYSIAKRVLDAFKTAHISPQIVYKRVDQQQYFLTNKSTFEKKGILVSYGGHSQWVLPLNNWTVKHGIFAEEPHNLPVVHLDQWLRPVQLGKAVPASTPLIDFDTKVKMAEIWKSRIKKDRGIGEQTTHQPQGFGNSALSNQLTQTHY